jgi:copper homeostasis protein (lipoprotein)
MLKSLLFLFLLNLLAVQCKNKANKQVLKDSAQFAPALFAGTFADTIPCADCAGIAVTLQLEPDETYIIKQNYLNVNGKDTVIYDLGKWSITDSILKLSNSTEIPKQYKIENVNKLSMLTSEAEVIKSISNLSYTLERLLDTSISFSNIPVNGMLSIRKDTMKFYVCALHTSYRTIFIPADTMAVQQYKMLTASDTLSKLMMYAKGYFERKPYNGEKFFVVEKFIRFAKNESCN